jgi:hypothetical protein
MKVQPLTRDVWFLQRGKGEMGAVTKESIIEKTYLLKISPLPSPKRLRAGRSPLFAKEG